MVGAAVALALALWGMEDGVRRALRRWSAVVGGGDAAWAAARQRLRCPLSSANAAMGPTARVLVVVPRDADFNTSQRAMEYASAMLSDPTFKIGASVELLPTFDAHARSVDVAVVPTAAARERVLRACPDVPAHRVVAFPPGALDASSETPPETHYDALRADLLRATRASSLGGVSVAFFNVWAGSRPPSARFIATSAAFTTFWGPTRSRVVAVVDAAAPLNEAPRGLENWTSLPGLRLVRIPNLLEYMQRRVDDLLPGMPRNRTYHSSGKKVAGDLRPMFGAMFAEHIPESEFSHWGWLDAHAFPADLFGLSTNFGRDWDAFDVLAFSGLTSSIHLSGGFVALRNNQRGRDLYLTCLDNAYAQHLQLPDHFGDDERACSDSILRAPNVTVAIAENMLFVTHHTAKQVVSWRDRRTGLPRALMRCANEPPGADTPPHVKENDLCHRFDEEGFGSALASLDMVSLRNFRYPEGKWGAKLTRGGSRGPHPPRGAPSWFRIPAVPPSHFPKSEHRLGVFGTMIRDTNGHWWLRPLPRSEALVVVRGANDSEWRSRVGVEMSLLHSRFPIASVGDIPDAHDAFASTRPGWTCPQSLAEDGACPRRPPGPVLSAGDLSPAKLWRLEHASPPRSGVDDRDFESEDVSDVVVGDDS